MKIPWYNIEPFDALGIELPRADIEGLIGDDGEPCPWPWEPQQLKGVPLGQYHCGYCGSMCLAGVHHVDYGEDGRWVIPNEHIGGRLRDE